MPLSVQCPQGHKLSVAEKYAGKNVKCPKCSTAFKIPELTPEPVVPAAIVSPLESLDFSTDSPAAFAADPFATDPFATPASGSISPPSTPHQYYQVAAAPAKKIEPVAPVMMSTRSIYTAAGAAFAVGFVLTLGFGLLLI